MCGCKGNRNGQRQTRPQITKKAPRKIIIKKK